jgi:hypothetical protein
LKGQRDKDSIDPRSTIQSLFLEIFERDKSGIQNIAAQNHSRSTIESSFAQVLCQQRCANYRYFFPGEMNKEMEMRKIGVQDPTIQSSFLQLSEKETLKGTWDEKRRSPRSYHPKFIIASF